MRTNTISRWITSPVIIAAAAVSVAACSSTGSDAATNTPIATTRPGNGTGGGSRIPGVSGLVAAVSGSTMQVQTRTSQTAVTWSATTSFSKLTTVSLADVTVGSCLTAMAVPGSGPATDATTITAGTVEVRTAVNGTCAPAGAGNPGRPTSTAAPTRTAAPGFGGVVSGQVTALAGSAITVAPASRAGDATTRPPVTVDTTDTTTFASSVTAAATDVAVGECATATGTTDETGAMTATAISLRPAVNGQCTGFAGGRPGAGAPTTGATSGQ